MFSSFYVIVYFFFEIYFPFRSVWIILHIFNLNIGVNIVYGAVKYIARENISNLARLQSIITP